AAPAAANTPRRAPGADPPPPSATAPPGSDPPRPAPARSTGSSSAPRRRGLRSPGPPAAARRAPLGRQPPAPAGGTASRPGRTAPGAARRPRPPAPPTAPRHASGAAPRSAPGRRNRTPPAADPSPTGGQGDGVLRGARRAPPQGSGPGSDRSESGLTRPEIDASFPPSSTRRRAPLRAFRRTARQGKAAQMSVHGAERTRRVTVRDLREMKRRGDKIVALTAYDFLFGRLVDGAGVDIVLVGDSLGQVVCGHDSTLPVTLDDMIYHGRAVRRAVQRAFLVVDMPVLSFQVSPAETLRNAGRIMRETGARGVKLGGGDEETARHVRALVRAGLPVMGHIGLTPQSVHAIGGYRVQGRAAEDAERLKAEARRL